MKYLLVFIFIIFFCLKSNAQFSLNWSRHYNIDTWASGFTALEMPNHEYYIFGVNDSLGWDTAQAPIYDYNAGLVYKTDKFGNTLDSFLFKKHDGLYFQLNNRVSDNFFEAASLMSDGNIVVAGETQSYNPSHIGDYDLWLVKFTPNLDTLWSKTFSVPDSQFIAARGKMAIDINDEIILFGRKVGYNNPTFPNRRPYIARFDSSGNLLSQKTIQGLGFGGISDLAIVGDGTFMISCYRQNSFFADDYSPQIAHIAADYSVIWDTILPFSQDFHAAESIIKTYDGNYIFTWHYIASIPGARNRVAEYQATKIDINGHVIWTKSYGYSFDAKFSVKELPNHDLLFWGQSTDTISWEGKGLLIRCNELGDTLWSSYVSVGGLFCYDVTTTSDGGYLLTGQIYGYNFVPNFGWTGSLWIAKVDSFGLLSMLSEGEKPQLENLKLGIPYPNPAIDIINVNIQTFKSLNIKKDNQNISLFIFDPTGKRIRTYKVSSENETMQINVKELASGIYLFALSVNGFNAGIQKWIKE